jgi:hypothetical protein
MAIEEKEKEDENTDTNNNTLSKQKPKSRSRTILIATFYETIDSVKHHFSAVGVKDVETLIDNGSLVIIDVFQAYHPDIDGQSRSYCHCRYGLLLFVWWRWFCHTIDKVRSNLTPKTEGGNIKGINCYHSGNYATLTEGQRKELAAQGQKKVLEVKEKAYRGEL